MNSGKPRKSRKTTELADHHHRDVTKSYSRPHGSDDNPFSENQFKTLRYRPGPADLWAPQTWTGTCSCGTRASPLPLDIAVKARRSF